MRKYTYVGAAVASGTVEDDGTLRRLKGRVSVGIRALSAVSTRNLDASKYGRGQYS